MQISKSVISDIRFLHQAKFRKETGLFIAEGEKVVGELLQSGLKVRIVAGLPDYLALCGPLPEKALVYEIDEKDLNRISLLQTPNRVLAVAEQPPKEEAHLPLENETVLVLDGIRDPGNLGTIIRTAEWFGVSQIWCSEDTVETFNPKVVQSAMGSLFRMKLVSCNLKSMLEEANRQESMSVFGATLDGVPADRLVAGRSRILVIGSESHGISAELLQVISSKVLIPRAKNSKTESLNAAVATGILLSAVTK